MEKKNSAPPQPTGSKLAYTAKELSALLGISTRSLSRLEKRALLPACRALRKKLYSAKAVEEFLRDNT